MGNLKNEQNVEREFFVLMKKLKKKCIVLKRFAHYFNNVMHDLKRMNIIYILDI